MQLAVKESKVIATGHKGEQQFSVSIGPHMMDILSGLYSDIPWAIVREYGTNMLDAYVKLPDKTKKQIPPIFHAPTNLEPYLEFKDFGVGMDYDTVWEVFTKYGASTKRDNDEEVGGLGLGSKVAFCYEGSDQWTVESRYNGKRMVFNANRGKHGVPTLIHIADIDTDEPNGVTIKIPVSPAHFHFFYRALERFLKYYPREYKLTGHQVKVPPLEYIVRKDRWAVGKDNPSADRNVRFQWIAVVGNIPYRVDKNQIDTKGLLEAEVHLFLDVADVDIVPSREDLKYTSRTKAAIERALANIITELTAETQEKIKGATTKWEALCLMRECWGSGTLRKLVKSCKWKGESISTTEGLGINYQDVVDAFPGCELYYVKQDKYGKLNAQISKVDDQFLLAQDQRARHTQGRSNYWWIIPDDVNNTVPFVIVDDREKADHVRAFVERTVERLVPTNKGYSRRSYSRDKQVEGLVIRPAEGVVLDEKKLLTLLEGFPITGYLSTMGELVRAAKPLAPRRPVQMKYWYGGRFVDIEVDFNQGGYYLPMDRNNTLTLSIDRVNEVWQFAQTQGLVSEDDILYGIPRTLKGVEKKPQWIEFNAFFKDKLEKKWEKRKSSYEIVKDYKRYADMGLLFAMEKAWGNRLPPELSQLARNALRARKVERLNVSWERMARMYDLIVPEAEEDEKNLFLEFLEPYPLLKSLALSLDGYSEHHYGNTFLCGFFKEHAEEYYNYYQERKIAGVLTQKRIQKS